MSETIGEKTSSEAQGANNNPWDSLSEKQPMTFQVAPGTTKEAEFKRLTGEDWPGKKYYAETSGVDDDGYDYPIEIWTIHERPEKPRAEFDGATFQVAPGTTKEAEFKRLTGEDWPGKKYYAETSGVDDDGYDYPIETWVVHARDYDTEDDILEDKPQQDPQKNPEKQEVEKKEKKVVEKGEKTDEEKNHDTNELELAHQKELGLARQKILEEYRNMTKSEKLAELESLMEEEARDRARLAEIDKLLSTSTEEKRSDDEKHKPLIAVAADFTYDKKDLAHDLAERNLNDEVSGAKGVKGFVKRLWQGTLFKKYYEQRYTREYMEGDRAVTIDGKEYNIDDLMAKRKDGAIARFVMSVTEDSEQFIHQKAGEKMSEADADATAKIRAIIERFATAQDVPAEDRKRSLEKELKRLRAEYRDDGLQVDQSLFDNYELVAEQAFDRVRHGIAIEDVMEGFKVYNAKVRDGARTETHRDAIDKIVNWFEGTAIGQFIPAEAMAAACSITAALTQTGARAVAGAAGGVLASSVISGLKERNRIAEDRARRLRDIAEGMSYEDKDRGVNKRTAEYEARIGDTLYDLRPARELISNIEQATNIEGEGRDEAILRAIAEARVRIDFSDAESKDLISYTSAEERGNERLKLDLATIRAEKALSDSEKSQLEVLKKQVTEEIIKQVDESYKRFRRMRAGMAVKKAGKTLILGATTFVVSQEVMAALNPGKVSILEKAGILKTKNTGSTTAAEIFTTGIAFGPETARTGLGGPAGSIVEGQVVEDRAAS